MSGGEVGRYFLLRCGENNKVLEVMDGSGMQGQPVILSDYHGDENQLWFEDMGVIKSKLDDSYVLDLDKKGFLCINTFSQEEPNQKWAVNEGQLRNVDTGLGLAIPDDAVRQLFANAVATPDNSNITVEYRPVVYGYIQSYLHSFVVDVKDSKVGTNAVANPIAKPVKPNQLFYENNDGILVCKLNNMVLEIQSDKLIKTAKMDPSKEKQRFVMRDTRVSLKDDPNMVLDIHGGNTSKGTKLCAWQYNGGVNQAWYFEPAS